MEINELVKLVHDYTGKYEITAEFCRDLARTGGLTAVMLDVFYAAGKLSAKDYMSLILMKGVK